MSCESVYYASYTATGKYAIVDAAFTVCIGWSVCIVVLNKARPRSDAPPRKLLLLGSSPTVFLQYFEAVVMRGRNNNDPAILRIHAPM